MCRQCLRGNRLILNSCRSIGEPGDCFPGSGTGVLESAEDETGGKPHLGPGAAILRIAPELLEAECSVRAPEEVDAVAAVLGLDARENSPGLVDASSHCWHRVPERSANALLSIDRFIGKNWRRLGNLSRTPVL